MMLLGVTIPCIVMAILPRCRHPAALRRDEDHGALLQQAAYR
jgi:hypothetical protein